MTFVQTHTHPYDEAFDADREEVLQKSFGCRRYKMGISPIDSTCYQRQLECFNNHPNNAFMTIGFASQLLYCLAGKEELKFVEEEN